MNETAAYLWKNVEGKDFDPDTLKNLLMKEYEVEETTADADAKTIAKQWIEAGIAE